MTEALAIRLRLLLMVSFSSVPNLNSRKESRKLAACSEFPTRLSANIRDPDRPESTFIGGRSLSSSSDSEECFRLAHFWLRRCVERHGCNAIGGSMRPKFLPTRTIEVGSADGSQDPRLICHEEEGEHITIESWATLSHCWGGSAPLKTTLATISQWQRGVPLDLLPPTFRDAVLITRRLGIRHLWIDSLCIIQDSAEDWESEAARMGDVYRHGLLNIAADTARTCNDGIISRRAEPGALIKLPLVSQEHNLSSSMYIRPGRWDDFRTDIMGSDSMLNSRAWVLQESLLSPRTLHYGKRQLVWECLNCSLSEDSATAGVKVSDKFGSAYMFSHKMLLPPRIFQQAGIQVSTKNDITERAELYNTWLQIITQYTKRKITVYSDIFSALAGTASILQAHLGDRYLAGLFEGDLERSLLWQAEDPSSTVLASPPLAPSWSWASIIGAIRPAIAIDGNMIAPRPVGNLAARILHAETYMTDGRLAIANYLLNAPSGMISLEGSLLRGKSLKELGYEGETLDSIQGDSANPNTVVYRQKSLQLDMDEDSNKHQDVAIFHMGAWAWRLDITNLSMIRLRTTFAGLVLRKSEDTAQNVHRRIGIANMTVEIKQNTLHYRFVEDVERLIGSKWSKEVVTIV